MWVPIGTEEYKEIWLRGSQAGMNRHLEWVKNDYTELIN